MIKITQNNIDFSIFSIALQSYLENSHPHLKNDLEFIKQRGDTAAKTFEQARREGASFEQAMEIANQILYLNLRFSVFNTIIAILWEEFEGAIPEYAFNDMALNFTLTFSHIIKQYELTDDFEQSEEYDKLYTELIGAILISLNEHGI